MKVIAQVVGIAYEKLETPELGRWRVACACGIDGDAYPDLYAAGTATFEVYVAKQVIASEWTATLADVLLTTLRGCLADESLTADDLLLLFV